MILVSSFHVTAENGGNGTEPIPETAKKEEADYSVIIIIIVVIVIIIVLPIVLVLMALYFTNRKLSQTAAQIQGGFEQFSMVPPPPCPYCNVGLIFVEKYRKWYCESCNSYY